MTGEGRHLRVEEDVDGVPGVRHVLAELPHDPSRGVQHLTYAVLLTAPREQVGVVKDGKLGGEMNRG